MSPAPARERAFGRAGNLIPKSNVPPGEGCGGPTGGRRGPGAALFATAEEPGAHRPPHHACIGEGSEPAALSSVHLRVQLLPLTVRPSSSPSLLSLIIFYYINIARLKLFILMLIGI